MDAATAYSMASFLQHYARLILVEWLVRILLLISMTVQLVLVVLGAHRYRCSSGIFRFVVWGAYISADAVAISALGTMMHHSAGSGMYGMYGIWAPVLVLHLGGPDAITAYSTADNELWLRHAFNMIYQVSVAVYVIISSALEGHILVAAILLLIAGATKYAERTLALCFASDSQIVRSCLPIIKCLKVVGGDRGYVVMGEKQEVGGSERGVVTTRDIKDTGINEEDCNLCLSHALFKMYMRRFVSLYFDEGDLKETRAFWCGLNGKVAFGLVEKELKFMYDVLFSKGSGTAFSRYGILLRLVNCLLVGAAGFLILTQEDHREAQWTVTYIVLSVALVVEVFQFCRIMTSDWTWVRLICAQVDIDHPLRRRVVKCECFRVGTLKVMEIVVRVLRKVQNVVAGERYWSNGIHQHCLIGTCRKRSRSVWKMAKFLPKADIYIASWSIRKVSVPDTLKFFIFDIVKQKCSPEYDSVKCRDEIYNIEEDLLRHELEIEGVMSVHWNLEEVILVWHIATTICDRKREILGEDVNVNVKEYVEWSTILSRYCAYLLVSRPRLLPLHPDMASITYMQLVEQLMDDRYYGIDPTEMLHMSHRTDQRVLHSGVLLAFKLLEREEIARWKLLAEYWAGSVIYMAVYNKAAFHAECLAGGGEFLSQVWVILGHMGCGEQSDSAVKKRRERNMSTEEKLERERVRERERQRERLRILDEWI